MKSLIYELVEPSTKIVRERCGVDLTHARERQSQHEKDTGERLGIRMRLEETVITAPLPATAHFLLKSKA